MMAWRHLWQARTECFSTIAVHCTGGVLVWKGFSLPSKVDDFFFTFHFDKYLKHLLFGKICSIWRGCMKSDHHSCIMQLCLYVCSCRSYAQCIPYCLTSAKSYHRAKCLSSSQLLHLSSFILSRGILVCHLCTFEFDKVPRCTADLAIHYGQTDRHSCFLQQCVSFYT